MGKVSLVGAGPGDPDLITLKGIKALQSADVVLYDALADPSLLAYCKKGCKKIYVGKKHGLHAYQQILINDMMVDHARRHTSVVRLKGGDPYVFGRGHEEWEYLVCQGIEVEVIPGVSSALAVPASNHIPLTKRGVNESFWVVTGTTTDGSFSKDLPLAAQSSATVIVLMGMHNLGEIIGLFRIYRGDDENVAIIQNGTRVDERKVVSTLDSVEQLTREKGLSSPAIIVIGAVVGECPAHRLSKRVFKPVPGAFL